jgi:hypothetical protein
MKAWKIRSNDEWSTDAKIICVEKREEAIAIFEDREIKNWGAIQTDRELDIEEWDIEVGSVITPQGYDSTDATHN